SVMDNLISRENLEHIICSSFHGTSYPGNEYIVDGPFPPKMYDSEEIYNLYHGRLWEELDDNFFFSHGALQCSINFLAPEAFVYYLPSFMKHIISPDWNWTTGCLLEGMLYELDKNNNSDKFSSAIKLSKDQSKAVALFLIYISSNHEEYGTEISAIAMNAFHSYWAVFSPS
ncbi:MAG: hypothetical protein LBI68_09835, partial [Azoarcus sp.]|nr:hypothetical protein [Azoarcus sp.]